MAIDRTGQGSVPAPPHRTQFFQNGQPTAELKNYLQSVGLSQDFFTNIVKALPILAVTLPWTQWFQAVGDHVNAASDLALLGATTDETARGALANQALVQSLLSILQPGQQREAVQQLLAVYFVDAPRGVIDNSLFYALCQDDRRPQQDEILAASLNDNARTDFRAFAIVDTHTNRAKVPANSVQIGQSFYETDRHYFYESDGTNWNLAGGCYVDTFANRPADLVATDIGALFYASDTNALYEWTGAAWSGAIVNAETGFRQNNAATANHVLASDGTNFVDRALVNANLPDAVAAHTITLLKLTGGGADGSITWNSKGVVTAFVDPT